MNSLDKRNANLKIAMKRRREIIATGLCLYAVQLDTEIEKGRGDDDDISTLNAVNALLETEFADIVSQIMREIQKN